MGFKLWKLPEHNPDDIDSLSRESGLSWVLSAVLISRGIHTAEEAESFISDSGEIEDPFVLCDMQKAVERIGEAIENEEKIAVYGDYDCDGVTATAILTSYLQNEGADVIYYVPDREKEGYGLNKDAIKMLSGQKVDLIVTVDNGISAHDEIDYAATLGIDVVVTDHHTPRQTMPNAVAVVNPHRADCKSSFDGLAGVGVAFKLICALENAHPLELLEYYSDIVALGTIADVVPLISENRAIVKHGLKRLTASERPGIEALLNISGLADRELSCEQAAFGIIPRINAAGRMGVADDVIELLLTDDSGYAAEMSELVNSQNIARKKAEEQIILEIDEILRRNQEILLKRVLVISGKGWHHGVVGIVASKIMERYGKPCILISIDGETARGSGRSIEGFSLIEAITACKSHLLRFGGHKLAAGMTLNTSEIALFGAALQDFALQNYPAMPTASYRIDCVLPGDKLTIDEISSLSVLEPFGAANEPPVFLLQGLTINGIYPTSDKKHLRLKLKYGSIQFYAIYFGMTEQDFPYRIGDTADVAASVTVGEYQGNAQLSVRLRDIRPPNVPQEQILNGIEIYSRHLRGEYSGGEDLAKLIVSRDDLAVIYKYLRANKGCLHGAIWLYYKLMNSDMDYCRMLVALDVMQELGLITRGADGNKIEVVPEPQKVNIDDSAILTSLREEMKVMRGG